MKRPAYSVLLLTWIVLLGAATPIHAQRWLFESPIKLTGDTAIDKVVLARLNKLKITPARVCKDHVFLRRVYLDVIGTLPTVQEAREFLKDKSPDKRSKLIDDLLNRDEFADYWAMKWGDLLRVKAEFPINLWPNAALAYHRWIHTGIRENKPYDRFARELLTSSGSNFRVPPVNFFRAVQSQEPESWARAAALAFMGMRIDKWEQDRREELTSLFRYVGHKPTREWKEEIIYFDAVKATEDAATGGQMTAVLPDGASITLLPNEDPRIAFADWLTAKENPYFARAVVNRIWYWLMGRGIIHEADDIRNDNPPANPKLLALLEMELIAAEYDLKHIYRLILNSKTYQLAPVPRSKSPKAETNFAYYPLRRLEAEVLIDAVCQITGTTEEYSSQIPEPFTFIPEQQRTITLPDGSITSSFLEMFGRPSRDTGLESERNNTPSAFQQLHMLNSSHIRNKIEKGRKLRPLTRTATKNPRQAVNMLYMSILSRNPTKEEFAIVNEYSKSGKVRGKKLVEDVAWALINSTEFLYRH
jgi:hypothetical protein